MASIIGNTIKLSIFGESHGECVGSTLFLQAPGIKIDYDFIKNQMLKRKSNGILTTPRIEDDEVEIISGVFNGYTNGNPITLIVKNKNTHSSDYEKDILRPSSADYTQKVKQMGFEDYRGSGFASARLTAALVGAGGIILPILKEKGIEIESRIISIHGKTGSDMVEEVKKAKEEEDSVGGIIETTIKGLEPGIGEPYFDSLESDIAKAIFSIPAVKGIEFGLGFGFASKKGSEVNDPFEINEGKVRTLSNNSGGIQGGISNGENIVFRTVFKPTPSIGKTQKTVNLEENKNIDYNLHGRHDPCVLLRADVIIDSLAGCVILAELCTRYGYLYMKGSK